MPRVKEYNEEEVIERAMRLFWRNGYKSTSLRMLSKEMGINQFSINASFGNKQNLFLESLKLYRKELSNLSKTLEKSPEGIANIKNYFYQFASFSNQDSYKKGCLIVNTVSEFGLDMDKQAEVLINENRKNIRRLFQKNLEADSTKDEETIKRQCNYLFLALGGLSLATKIQGQNEIEDYIETTFQNL